MPSSERREYRGSAAATTLNGAISAGASTVVLTDATNWPDGSVGLFFLVVDRGLAAEEKIKCISRTGNTVTVVTSPSSGRGADNTVATTHVSGAAVEHVWTADDANLANLHTADTTVDNHTQYLNVTRHDVTARHPVGTAIGAGTPGNSVVGDTATQGVSTNAARADHKHGREVFGASSSASAVADTQSPGSATTPARSDHKHAREVFGTSVQSVDTATSAGAATNPARVDHTHDAPQHVRLIGRTAAAAGGSPPAAGTGPWKIQAGYSNVTTDGSGNFTVTFPTAFPNGVIAVTPVNPVAEFINLTAITTSTFTCKASVTDGGGHVVNAGAGVNFNVSWIAIGW